MITKHLARWLLLFGVLIAVYYVYKAFMNIVSTATAPITGIEDIASTAVKAVTGGIGTLYNDVKTLAGNIVGGETGGVSDNPTSAALTPSIVPGVNTTPQDIATYSGVDTSNLPYQWSLQAGGITLNPNNQNP